MDHLPTRSEEALERHATVSRKGRSLPGNLREQVDEKTMRLWPTPQARDYRSGDEPDSIRAQRKQEQGWSPNLNDSVKMWSTPAANDAKNASFPPAAANWDSLPGDIMRLYPTPRANKPEGYSSDKFRPTLAQAATGEPKPLAGQLNPAWACQLMGFPVGWTDPGRDEPIVTPFPAPMGCDQYPWEEPRVAEGVKQRTHMLKALGNAVVPQIPRMFGTFIMAIEGGLAT